jgi:hypothetical protein
MSSIGLLNRSQKTVEAKRVLESQVRSQFQFVWVLFPLVLLWNNLYSEGQEEGLERELLLNYPHDRIYSPLPESDPERPMILHLQGKQCDGRVIMYRSNSMMISPKEMVQARRVLQSQVESGFVWVSDKWPGLKPLHHEGRARDAGKGLGEDGTGGVKEGPSQDGPQAVTQVDLPGDGEGNTCQSTSQDTREGGGVTDGGREEGGREEGEDYRTTEEAIVDFVRDGGELAREGFGKLKNFFGI